MKAKPALAPRKEPRQARSRRMRADILEASIRVLRDEGPLRFTTQRVADIAGVSVGSLYQYFPNKEALVYAIHLEVVADAWAAVERILDDGMLDARAKLARIAIMYFIAEARDHAEMGAALQGIEIYFPEQSAHHALDEEVGKRLSEFLRATPRTNGADAADHRFEADLLATVLESVGKSVATRNLPRADLERWGLACSDMICDYLRIP